MATITTMTGSTSLSDTNGQQQDVIIVCNIPQTPKNEIIYEDFNAKKSNILGTVQLGFGTISILFNVLGGYFFQTETEDDENKSYNNPFNIYLFIGITAPIFYLTSGILAIYVAEKKTWQTYYKIRALLGTSITSCVMGFTQASSAVAVMFSDGMSYVSDMKVIIMCMAAGLMAAGLVEAATSIWLSKLCGNHICCNTLSVDEVNAIDAIAQEIEAIERQHNDPRINVIVVSDQDDLVQPQQRPPWMCHGNAISTISQQIEDSRTFCGVDKSPSPGYTQNWL